MIKLQETLLQQIKDAGLPQPEIGFGFSDCWRYDLSWPSRMIGIDLKPMHLLFCNHPRTVGYINHIDKMNHAQLNGWLYLQFSEWHITSNKAIAQLIEVYKRSAYIETIFVQELDSLEDKGKMHLPRRTK